MSGMIWNDLNFFLCLTDLRRAWAMRILHRPDIVMMAWWPVDTTGYQNLNVSRLVLQLSLCIVEPGVKSRMRL